MSDNDWRAVEAEFDRWQNCGLSARFWVRDDDACHVTAPLERLQLLADRFGIEVGLAVIPQRLGADLVAHLHTTTSPFHPMCHGWRHENHARTGPPAEFGTDRDIGEVRADLACAQSAFNTAFDVPAIFVPPFNRISPIAAAELARHGFAALSCAPSLELQRLARLHANTRWLPRSPVGCVATARALDVHIDPVDWSSGTAQPLSHLLQTLLGELRMRRRGYIPASAPIGLLFHHLVHDDGVWRACEEMVAFIRSCRAARFIAMAELLTSAGVPSSAPARATG